MCCALYTGWWAVRVSRVYVKAVLPFRRVLAISKPLTHPTQGIMGINEWYCMTLASHHHYSNSTSRSVGFVCVFVLPWLCVYVGNVCAVSWDVKKKIERKGVTHKHLIQGQPVQCRPPFPWDLYALIGNKSNKRTTEIWKLCEISPQCMLRCWHSPQDELKFQGKQ